MKNLIKFSLVSLALVAFGTQAKQSLDKLGPTTDKPIEVIKLASDKTSSAFVIFIRDQVRLHRHNQHTETLYVLAGRAEMSLAGQALEINPGDFISIPPGTAHGVTRVLSDAPLKVLSLQAPEFLGKDREFLE